MVTAGVVQMSEDKQQHVVESLLATILMTLGAIAVAAISLSESDSFVDTLLIAVALLCILGAALLVDHIMDELEIGLYERLSAMNSGYLCFAFAVSGFVFISLSVYSNSIGVTSLPAYVTIIFAVSSIAVFLKLMTRNDYSVFSVLSFASLVASVLLVNN